MGSGLSERRDWANPTAFCVPPPPASSCAGAETEVEGKRPPPPARALQALYSSQPPGTYTGWSAPQWGVGRARHP